MYALIIGCVYQSINILHDYIFIEQSMETDEVLVKMLHIEESFYNPSFFKRNSLN